MLCIVAPQSPPLITVPVIQASSTAETLNDIDSALAANWTELMALLHDFNKARERFLLCHYDVETFLEHLILIAIYFDQPDRPAPVWHALIRSGFFSFLQYDLCHLETCSESHQTYRVAIFECLMALFRAAERLGTHATCEALSRSSIFNYICHNYPSTPVYFPIDRVAVLSALLWVQDARFAEVLTFVHLHSELTLLDWSVIDAAPRVLEKFLRGKYIYDGDHDYQAHTWFYKIFIVCELNSERDVDRFPDADMPAFSMAAVVAVAEWLRPDSGYDPVPVLDVVAPTILPCFPFVLREAREEVKYATIPVLVLLLEQVWPPDTAASYLNDLAVLIPSVIDWISEGFGPVCEATSRLITLLIPEFLDDDCSIDFAWLEDESHRFLWAAVALAHPVTSVREQAMAFLLACLEVCIDNWGLRTEILGVLARAVIDAIATADDSLSATGLRLFDLLLDLGPYRTGGPTVEWPSNLLAILPCCADALNDAPDTIKSMAMNIVLKLFGRCWRAMPWEPRRHVLDVLGPAVLQIITCQNRALVQEGLRFLHLFVDQATATHDDVVDCPWLSDPSRLVFCCVEALQTGDEQLKRTAIHLIVLFLEHVWLVRPREGDARQILDHLAPHVIDVVLASRGFLAEAGLRFFALFIDQGVYDEDDAEHFNWLSELREQEYGNSAMLYRRLMDYWMRSP
jgi:hypothetical protein